MRKSISKKLRFEVFKRDSFTCQYCGGMAPDVILHIDHIHPVASGGGNEIVNLITSCVPCNQGKGARKLSDNSEVKKQQKHIKHVNERRLQLEMLMSWRSSMKDEGEQMVDAFCCEFGELGHRVTDFGRQSIKKWLKKHTISEILSALDIGVAQYARYDAEGKATQESVIKIFSYVPRIAAARKKPDYESMQQIYYVRGILNNRLSYVNQRACLSMMVEARDAGVDIDDIQEMAKSVRSWTAFGNELDSLVREVCEHASA